MNRPSESISVFSSTSSHLHQTSEGLPTFRNAYYTRKDLQLRNIVGRGWERERNRALIWFLQCVERVQQFVERTPLSDAVMDQLALFLTTCFNQIYPLNPWLRQKVLWSKITPPTSLVTPGGAELGLSPILEYLAAGAGENIYTEEDPYNLENPDPQTVVWGLFLSDTLPGQELTVDPTNFRVVFKFGPPSNKRVDRFHFYTTELSSREVMDYFTRGNSDPESPFLSFWDKGLLLLTNRDVTIQFLSADREHHWFQPTWEQVTLRMRRKEPTELIFQQVEGSPQILRTDPGFEAFLAVSILNDQFPEREYALKELLGLLRKGFVVQGWVVQYHPEDYRFMMEKDGLRVPVIGGLELADLLIGCFPPNDLPNMFGRRLRSSKVQCDLRLVPGNSNSPLVLILLSR